VWSSWNCIEPPVDGRPSVASIERRTTKSGALRFKVRWREGGRREGDWDGETFDDNVEAKRFKALVDANRNRRPSVGELLRHDFAYLLPEGLPTSELQARPAVVAVAKTPHGDPSEDSAVEQPIVTFRQFACDYIDRLVRPHRETKRKYLERLERHVFPIFGHRPIGEITRRELREWQSNLIHQGMSPKTIANIRGEALSPIFEAACRPGEDDEPPLRAYNPLKGLALPQYDRPERDIVETQEEASIFIAAAYEIDPEAADLIVTKLATGMRWGEIAGLPVRAVHPDWGTISIQQVLRREYHSWVVVPKPKTRKGFRQIPVPVQVMEMLGGRCMHRPRTAFVFTAPEGNFWRYSQFYDGRWKKVVRLAATNGLSKHITLHGLRHSLLTLLATEGIDLDALRQIAGHKHISTTYDLYVHSSRKHDAAVKAVVGSFVSGPSGAMSAAAIGQSQV
jgi:integrase